MTMKLREYLLRKLEKNNMSQMDLAKASGLSASSISRLISGDRGQRVPLETLSKLSVALKVPLGDLTTLIEGFGGYNLSTTDSNDPQKKTPVKGVKIPILGNIVAGVPIEAVTDIIGYEEIHPDLAKTGEFFGLKVKGDSMTPRICDGDIVIVRKQPNVECGELAVVLINGEEATLKKVVKKEDGIVLEAFNPVVYSPKFYSYKEVEDLPIEILGKVIELRGKF